LTEVFDPDNKNYTQKQAVETFKSFILSWANKYPALRATAQRDDVELFFTYLNYDYRVRRMIYTTNWIERLNKAIRRTTKVRNALPTPEAALNLIAFVGMDMEQGVYSHSIQNFIFEKNYGNNKLVKM